MFHFETCQLVGLLAEMPRPVWAPWLIAKGSLLSATIMLFAGHALCDYPLQGQFLADAKNHRLNPKGWMKDLFTHSMIHAGMVLWITGSTVCALAELGIHMLTDWAKCDGRINSNQDQAIHYTCKLAWALVVAYSVTTL